MDVTRASWFPLDSVISVLTHCLNIGGHYTDQWVQYTCADWRRFVSDNNLEPSMSRRGNCHDNAVAESFFSLLKTERIKRKNDKTRKEAMAEIFNYIEFCYNPGRRHENNGGVTPVEFEKRYYES